MLKSSNRFKVLAAFRTYHKEQMRRLQIVALLRKTGYTFDAIRTVLQELAEGIPEQAQKAAEKRLQELAEKSRRYFEATAALWTYVEEFCP